MLKSQQGRALKKSPRRRAYSCDACPKQFETPSKLARHYLTHTGQKPFQCLDCSKTFRQLVHLERHMVTHTLPFQCHICHRHFKNADTFSKHQRLHTEGARLKVKVPKKPAASRRRRRTSLPLCCFGCQRTFESEEKRLAHQCDFVNVAAISKQETRQCSLCEKAFPSRSKLERHVMIHTGQKPFACAVCGKSFRQKAHLKIHEQTHTKVKPFQCGQCFKSFKTAEQLLKHEEFHAAVSDVTSVGISPPEVLQVKFEPDEIYSVYVIPFQCLACDQCFDSQETQDSHMCKRMNTHVAVAPCPKVTSDRAPVKKPKRLAMDLDQHNVLLPANTELSERLGNAKEMRYDSDSNAPVHPPFVVPKNILQQKAKTPRNHRRQPRLHLGRHFRNQNLNLHDKRVLDNREAGLMQSSKPRDPAQLRDPFHTFLQQAHGVLMPRYKASRCDRCGKTFPSMSKLRRHYLIHTGQKPFSCAECGRSFRQSAHLKRHQVTHAEKEHLYRLRIAQGVQQTSVDTWQENPSYQLHQHSGSPTENCRNINQSAIPKIKVKIEASDLPEVTKKPLVTKRARITLPRVHNKCSQERPLQKRRTRTAQKGHRCNECSKNFLSPSKLERHHLTHSGQRPFVCQECGKSFRQDPHLKRHMVTHVKLT